MVLKTSLMFQLITELNKLIHIDRYFCTNCQATKAQILGLKHKIKLIEPRIFCKLALYRRSVKLGDRRMIFSS